MQTIIVDVINEEAIKLLEDLESLKLIRVRKEKDKPAIDWVKYKGAMTKQPLKEVDEQLTKLREAWD